MEMNNHKQWILQREFDDRSIVDSLHWSKLSDSLSGINAEKDKNDAVGYTTAIVPLNSTFIPLDNTESFLESGRAFIDNSPIYYSWKTETGLYGIEPMTFSFSQGTEVIQQDEYDSPKRVPDNRLTDRESMGIEYRPLQGMFSKDWSTILLARKNYFQTVNTILSKNPYLDTWIGWTDYLMAGEEPPRTLDFQFESDNWIDIQTNVNLGIITRGMKVLLTGDQYNGFWTLWKYEPYYPESNQYGFILIRSQKWNLQEGEFWRYKDWYKEGWSTSNYPIVRYKNIQERNNDIQIGSTLLKGTLARIDQQNDFDTRWSWCIYDGSNWEEIAKEKATIEFTEKFWDKSGLDYAVDSYNVQNIKNRNGAWEIHQINDFLKSFMSNQEINQIFIDSVRIAMSLTTVDWALKSSLMQISGYSEQLLQHPVIVSDRSENLIEFVNDYKPYHVTMRDFVKNYSSGPDNINARITDFDKPLYQETSGNRVLQPITKNGTFGFNNGNAVDTNIVSTTRPWRDWWENYGKTEYSLNNWGGTWNPVRKIREHVLFDRVACKSNEITSTGDEFVETGTFGKTTSYNILIEDLVNIWKTENPKDPSMTDTEYESLVEEYRSELTTATSFNVYEIDELTSLVQNNSVETASTVYVAKNRSRWFWNGLRFIEYKLYSRGGPFSTGAIDRINDYYSPTIGMKPHDSELISGCSFRGTNLIGGNLEYGILDEFPLDEGGFGNESGYFLGSPDDAATGVGNIPIPEINNRQRDKDIKGPTFVEVSSDSEKREQAAPFVDPNTNVLITDYQDNNNDGVVSVPILTDSGVIEQYGIANTVYIGNDYVMPLYDSGNPEELARCRTQDPLIITVYQNAEGGANPRPSSAFRITKSSTDSWYFNRMNEKNMTVIHDIFHNSSTIDIMCPEPYNSNSWVLHDPENPTDEFKEAMKNSIVEINPSLTIEQSDDLFNTIMAKRQPGYIWLGNEKISYGKIELISGNIYRISKLVRGVYGTNITPANADSVSYWESNGIQNSYAFPSIYLPTDNINDVVIQELHYKETSDGKVPHVWQNLQNGIHFDFSGENFIFNVDHIPAPPPLDLITDPIVISTMYPTLSTNDAISKMKQNLRMVISRKDYSGILHKTGTKVYDATLINNLPNNGIDKTRYPMNTNRQTLLKQKDSWQTKMNEVIGPTP